MEEARVEQMQDGVFDAADVLVDGQPFLCRRFIYHAGVALRAGVACVVPRRFDEGVHGVCLAARFAAASGAGAFVKFRHLCQR